MYETYAIRAACDEGDPIDVEKCCCLEMGVLGGCRGRSVVCSELHPFDRARLLYHFSLAIGAVRRCEQFLTSNSATARHSSQWSMRSIFQTSTTVMFFAIKLASASTLYGGSRTVRECSVASLSGLQLPWPNCTRRTARFAACTLVQASWSSDSRHAKSCSWWLDWLDGLRWTKLRGQPITKMT